MDSVLEVTPFQREDPQQSLKMLDSKTILRGWDVDPKECTIKFPTKSQAKVDEIRITGLDLTERDSPLWLCADLRTPFCCTSPLVECLVLAFLVDWDDLNVSGVKIILRDGICVYFDVVADGKCRKLCN